MKEIVHRITYLETSHNDLKIRFEARGKNHEENARAMREFAELSNKLMDKVGTLEKEQAIHNIVLEQFGDASKKLEQAVDKLVEAVQEIKASFISNASRETTIRWIARITFQMIVLAGTISGTLIGIFNYIGK